MNNKGLYNKIMCSVSKEVKHILNEDIQKFDVVDYEDDEDNIITHETVDNICITDPAIKSLLDILDYLLNISVNVNVNASKRYNDDNIKFTLFNIMAPYEIEAYLLNYILTSNELNIKISKASNLFNFTLIGEQKYNIIIKSYPDNDKNSLKNQINHLINDDQLFIFISYILNNEAQKVTINDISFCTYQEFMQDDKSRKNKMKYDAEKLIAKVLHNPDYQLSENERNIWDTIIHGKIIDYDNNIIGGKWFYDRKNNTVVFNLITFADYNSYKKIGLEEYRENLYNYKESVKPVFNEDLILEFMDKNKNTGIYLIPVKYNYSYGGCYEEIELDTDNNQVITSKRCIKALGLTNRVNIKNGYEKPDYIAIKYK